MTELLVYWRDCRRNREAGSAGDDLRLWHSSSPQMGRLSPGDRMWLVTSGRTLGLAAADRGYLVEVWTVMRVVANAGESAAYPRDRYAYRVTAAVDVALTTTAPLDVDDLIRPVDSAESAPIGRLLQGPRKLSPEIVERLTTRVAAPHAGDRFRPATAIEVPTAGRGLDSDVIALGIRQPWAELILQGLKTIEVRTLETNVRGPIYLYTAKLLADIPAARRAIERHQLDADALARGSIVGVVEVVGCRPCTRSDAAPSCVPAALLTGKFAWELANPRRIEPPVKPRFLPYGVWFYPFRRRNQESSR